MTNVFNLTNQHSNNFTYVHKEFIAEMCIGGLLFILNMASTILLIVIVCKKEMRRSKHYSFVFITSLNNFLLILVYMVAILKNIKPSLFHSSFWCRISIILIHFYTYSLGFIFDAFALVYCIAVVYPALYLQLDSFYKGCYVLIYSLSLLLISPLIPIFDVATTPNGYKMCFFINNTHGRVTYSVVLALLVILPTTILIITFYKIIKHIYFSNEIQTHILQYIGQNKNIQNNQKNDLDIDQHQNQTNSHNAFNQENLAIKMSTFVYVRNFFYLNIVMFCVCWIPYSVNNILMIQGFLQKNLFYRMSHLLTLNYPAFHSIFLLIQNKKINTQAKIMFGISTQTNALL